MICGHVISCWNATRDAVLRLAVSCFRAALLCSAAVLVFRVVCACCLARRCFVILFRGLSPIARVRGANWWVETMVTTRSRAAQGQNSVSSALSAPAAPPAPAPAVLAPASPMEVMVAVEVWRPSMCCRCVRMLNLDFNHTCVRAPGCLACEHCREVRHACVPVSSRSSEC